MLLTQLEEKKEKKERKNNIWSDFVHRKFLTWVKLHFWFSNNVDGFNFISVCIYMCVCVRMRQFH